MSPREPRIHGVLIVVAGIALGGCLNLGGNPDAGDQSPSDLNGSAFVATALSEGAEARPIVPVSEALGLPSDARISVAFGTRDLDVLSWAAGCNRTYSPLEITDERLLVEDRFGSTLVGCSGAVGKQEAWVTRFLISDPEWTLEGDQLTLTSGESTIELRTHSGEHSPALARPEEEVPVGAKALIADRTDVVRVRCSRASDFISEVLLAYPAVDFAATPTAACVIELDDGTILDLLRIDREWTKISRARYGSQA